MKQISKKSKILVAALIAFMVVICGAVTFTPTELKSQEVTQVSTSWYQFEHGTDSITIRLNDDIRSLRKVKKEDISKLKNELTSALKTMFMDEILNSTPETPEGNGIMRTALTLPEGLPSDYDPDTFWDEVEGNPRKFKDYIVDRLSDPDELKSFSEGAYDMLLEQAIGEYISDKKKDGVEDLEQEYAKIQDAIDKAVEDAAEKAVEKQVEKEAERVLAQEFAKEYYKEYNKQPSQEEIEKHVAEKKEDYMSKNQDSLKEAAKKTIEEYTEEIQKEGGVVANAVQKVEDNGGAAPSISVQDMLEALKSVSIDGVLLYDKENKDDTIRNEGIRALMSKLPRPAVVANMEQDAIKNLFQADFKLGTTYGDIKINFTFGFYGTTRNVQRMAKAIADHVEVVRDGSDLTVNLTMPELVSKFFRSLYNAGGINYESKKAIFDFFDSSVADFANGKAYSFEELITLLKDINYQKLFENLLSASALNNYFGSYLTEMFGRTITDKDIERAITSLRNYALKVDKWTAQNVADFLYNIPGFKKLADSVASGKLNNVVEKFLEMVQKINWQNYDAKQIIEILKGDTINQKVLDNLDTYSDTYSGIYNKLLSSLSEMCDLLPFATDKLSTLYKEDGELNYEGKLTLDFGEIIGKISDIIGGNSESEGESETESFLGNLKTALSSKKFEYNLKLNVTTPDINKVQFVYDFEGNGNYEVLDEGLLPTNTNIKSLAPQTIEFRDGTSAEVGHWVEVDAEVDKNNPEASAVTKMPNRDIRLRAVFDLDEEIEIEVVNPHVVPTIKGYSPSANRRVEYTYMGGERSVRWDYELKAVSKTEKNYPSEVLKTWLSATIGGVNEATNVGNYKSTLKLTVESNSEYAKYITLKDLKKGESELEYNDTWTIEKANVKVEGIKLGSEEEDVLPGDEEYALFIKDITGGEHTVEWQFTLSVTNDYGNYWTDENIREYLDIVEGGTLKSAEADKDLATTLKINVKAENQGNFSMVAVDETAKWMIKCEDFIPKTEIDLTNAKWMYDNKEYTSGTEIEADGKEKALTVEANNEQIAKYFEEGILKVEYEDADGNVSFDAPTDVGTYTVRVVLTDDKHYTLTTNIDETTLNIIEKVLPREEIKIDLSDAKWMRGDKEHKSEDKIITDGTSDVKLTVETNETNKQYFDEGILEIVYYYASGMKLKGAPSKVGNYIARVVLVKNEVEKDGKIYVYSIEKNIDDTTMKLRTETTVAPAETVEIDLSAGKWMLNGEELTSETELVEDGTFKFLKVSGLDDATARLFTKGVLTIAYYKDGESEKMTHAPIDAGKYTAKVELRVTEGYNIEKNIEDATFEIKARPSRPDDVVIDLTGAKWQYEGNDYDPTKTIEKTGEKIELTITGIDDKYITDDIIEIVYYNGEGKMESAPVEAGIYFVRVGLKAETGYKLGSSMETIIIITEKKAEPVEIDVSSVKWTLGEEEVDGTITVTADGTRKELSISGLDDEYIENGIVEIVYYDEDGHRLLAAPKTAGTYTAKLEVRGDGYTLSGDAQVTIIIEDDTTVAPAEPVEIDLSKAKWVYRGAEIEITESTTLYFDGTAKNLEIEAGVIIAGYFVRDILAIEYYEGKDKLDGAPTEVGEYTAKVVLKDTKNYKLTGEIEDLSFEIVEDPSYIEPGTKIAIDLTGAKWMLGDSEVTDRVEIESDGRAKALTVSSSDAKITEYFTNGILRVVYVDKDNHESEIAPSLVGTYTVKVIVSDADRYELTNIANVTLVITEAAVQPVAKIEITLTGAKWFMGDAEFDFAEIEEDGLSKALTVGGISADLQRYFTSGVLVINYYDANGNKLFGAPKDAGVYTVKVELADANKYELKENIANATLTISEKDGNGHWWLIILTICIALVVIVAIVLVELLVISKKKKQDKPQGEDQPQEK